MADQAPAVGEQHRPVFANTLRHYWYAVARSEQVADRPLAVRLLDQPLVLWRSQDQPAAFYDLCIHRGTPLSLGWVDQGQLVCAYHGWSYGPGGGCTRIPALPPERGIPAKARATAYRCEERYGLVWVCLDDPVTDIPSFPPEFNDPTYRWGQHGASEGHWQVNAARFIENMMDISHFAWVHPGSLGDRDRPEVPDIELEPMEDGFQWEVTPPASGQTPSRSPVCRQYQIVLPFMIVFRQWNAAERQINFFVGTPISTRETRYFRFVGLNYQHHLPVEELHRRSLLIAEQDREIVEAQRPEELPLNLNEELHLRGPDTAAVEYRRRLHALGVAWQ